MEVFISDNIIKSFYRNVCKEDDRLISRSGNVEFITTMEYIHRYLGDMVREKLIATDGAVMYIGAILDELSEEEYNLFIKYHLKTCERQDLIGAANHSLDILRKL